MTTKVRLFSSLLAISLVACGQDAPEDPIVAASAALSDSSDAAEAPEMAGLMGGARVEPTPGVFEGFHCDRNPVITYADVCGRSYPSQIHLQWSACSPPMAAAAMARHGAPSSSGTVDVTNTVTASSCDAGATLTFSRSVTFTVTRTRPN